MGKKKIKAKAKKLDCCERFAKKGKPPCKDCPLMERLSKKEKQKLLG